MLHIPLCSRYETDQFHKIEEMFVKGMKSVCTVISKVALHFRYLNPFEHLNHLLAAMSLITTEV